MKKVSLGGTPNKKQIEFFKSHAKYTAYGGARGGGKSWALRRKLIMLCLRYPGIKTLIIRRTFPELRENHIKPLREELTQPGIAKYNESHKCFYFINGSVIRLGYCDNESDVLQYQGQEYDIIALDEATQLTEYQFETLKACLRGANDFPKRFYLTCNPGGVGHAWVKRLFVERSFKETENPSDYSFIPASVYDNKVLLKKSPDYLDQLKSLPHELREAWLHGKWDVFAGQYFKEFDRSLHTCEPVAPQEDSRMYCAVDYGLDMFAAVFVAVSPDGSAYVYDEIHVPGLIVSQAASLLNEKLNDRRVTEIIAPADLWSRQKDSGKSISDIFADHGVYFIKLSSGREDGWLALKEWLKPLDNPRHTKMVISRKCENLIRCLPLLMHDEHNITDVSTKPHDITHAPDALRYFAVYCRSVPAPVKPKAPAKLKDKFLRRDSGTRS